MSVAQILGRTGRLIRGQDPAVIRLAASITALRERNGTTWFNLADPFSDPRHATLHAKLHSRRRILLESELVLVFNRKLVGCTVIADIRLGLDRQGRIRGTIENIIEICPGLEQRGADLLIHKLRDEGVLRKQAGHSAPLSIDHVAVICPSNSEAQADVKEVLDRLFGEWTVRVTWLACVFEGGGAAASLCAALDFAEASRGPDRVDLILIVRGGGEPQALAWLDNETLARRISGLEIPVIAGIGHAENFGVVDAVAWHAAATPSDAAQHVHRLISKTKQAVPSATDPGLPASEQVAQAEAQASAEGSGAASVPQSWQDGEEPPAFEVDQADAGPEVFGMEPPEPDGHRPDQLRADTVLIDPSLTWMGRNPDLASWIAALPNEVVDHIVASAYPRAFGSNGRIGSVEEAYKVGRITLAFPDGMVPVMIVMPELNVRQ